MAVADVSRFSLTSEKYLDKHHVLTYMEDAITQLLEHKDDNPKVNPSKFFSEYFTSVKEGNHVMFREYAFVHATPHNRASFVRTFWKCFRNIGRKGDLLSMKEYHSLICLLCADFPFEPIQKTAKIILMDDAMDCLISFSDFLFAFQIQFCYEDFLAQCAEVYKILLHSPLPSSHETVVVPTSEVSPTVHQNTSEPRGGGQGVDAMQFFRSLLPTCERQSIHSPPVPVLREILASSQRVTFYGFLMAMAKADTLNKHIGQLPCKEKLLEMSDTELTNPPIRPSSALKNRPLSGQANLRPLSSSMTTISSHANVTSTNRPVDSTNSAPRFQGNAPLRPHSAHLNARERSIHRAREGTAITDSDDSSDARDTDTASSNTN